VLICSLLLGLFCYRLPGNGCTAEDFVTNVCAMAGRTAEFGVKVDFTWPGDVPRGVGSRSFNPLELPLRSCCSTDSVFEAAWLRFQQRWAAFTICSYGPTITREWLLL
jgi:hypothetical protein